MAAQSRGQDTSLIGALIRAPHRFEFIQAVRLIEQWLRRRRAKGDAGAPDPAEAVRFRAALALAFPLAEIDDLSTNGPDGGLEMQVAFLGLDGSSGALPRHYSEMVLHEQRQKNLALRDFLDIFNHRAVALHLAAQRKYRQAAGLEATGGDGSDPITLALYALVGMGTGGLRDRLAVEDETLIHYAGLFASGTRSAAGLEQLLSDYLGRPVEVIQFAGRWAPLEAEDWTAMPTSGKPLGSYAQLGVDAVAGSHVWDVQGGFRLRIGPLDYGQFAELLPGSPLMNEIAALVRTYAGPEFAFDMELALRGGAVPHCTLAAEGEFLPRLGWNTWLHAPVRPATVSDALLRYTRI
jgi:type VI secretion system protein ImpH